MRTLAAARPGHHPDEEWLLSMLDVHERLLLEIDRLGEHVRLPSAQKPTDSR